MRESNTTRQRHHISMISASSWTLIAIWVVIFAILLQWTRRTGLDSPSTDFRKTVVIFTGQAFHDEVTAAVACMLHALDHKVVVNVKSSVSIGGFTVQFMNHRMKQSSELYGRCVHQWVPYSSPAPPVLPDRIDAVVMTTFPMKTGRKAIDPVAVQLLKQVHEHGSDVKLLLITHRAKPKFWLQQPEIQHYVPLERTVFLFLAEHTYNHAMNMVTMEGATDLIPKITYLYPLVPLSNLFDRDYSADTLVSHTKADTSIIGNTGNAVVFTIQGHFGGKHAKRRNIDTVRTCLNTLAGTIHNNSTSTIILQLVGRGASKVNPGPLHPAVEVVRRDDLAPLDFHRAVARSHFLLTALGNGSRTSSSTSTSSRSSSSAVNDHVGTETGAVSNQSSYYTLQATSTVPLALTLQVPIVMRSDLLQLYPCLRDAPTLQLLAGENECASMGAAVTLSAEKLALAREEMRNCSDRVWSQALKTLQFLLSS